MKFKLIAKLLLAAMAVLTATQAMSETRVTYKSAKSTSSYYQMAVQIAEGVKAGSNGCLLYTSPSPRDGLLSRMPSSA